MVWKEQFPGKKSRKLAALKNDSRSENLYRKANELPGARLRHEMKHAAKIPVLATDLMAAPGAEELCQCGPVTESVFPAQRAIRHDFKRELTFLQALYCAECAG